MDEIRAAGKQAGPVWIVADIGGTHARLACWSAEHRLDSRRAARYRNDDFADLPALIDQYRRQFAPEATHAALAVALPVGRGELRMTNRDWRFSVDGLRAALGLARVRLLNDFVAAAAGVHDIDPRQCTPIGPHGEGAGGLDAARATTLVLGPGTGLGAAALVGSASGAFVIATEAGHMGAAPTAPLARAACELARARFGRASWERLLSGAGLALLDTVARGTEAARAPAEVAAQAQAGEAAARRAASAFSHALGEFAGDLCLAFGARRVYLTGGVLHGLGTALDTAALRAGFDDKGRFRARLQAVGCWLVHSDDLALRGLANMLAGAVEVPAADSPDDAR